LNAAEVGIQQCHGRVQNFLEQRLKGYASGQPSTELVQPHHISEFRRQFQSGSDRILYGNTQCAPAYGLMTRFARTFGRRTFDFPLSEILSNSPAQTFCFFGQASS
jgi:hypothetical protein